MSGEQALDRRLAAIGAGSTRRQINAYVGLRAVFYSKAIVHRKTGHLARTIRLALVTDELARIEAGGTKEVGYAAAVEFGTAAHDIVPRNRKVLAWGGSRRQSGSLRKGAKATHFAKKVHHPGTRAFPYMRPGAQKALAEGQGSRIIIQAWNRAA